LNSRKAQKNGFNGPTLGVKLAEENKREFTEEQLRAGEAVIGLQGKIELDTVFFLMKNGLKLCFKFESGLQQGRQPERPIIRCHQTHVEEFYKI
jgi:hypothetical protein